MLERIRRHEPRVRAWTWLGSPHSDQRLDAGELMKAIQETSAGPLAGLGLAVKDVIDVAGMPTANGLVLAGSPARAIVDAHCVALLRRAGAVPIGKTVTAEMAYAYPGPTANPWNPSHTPGGSSSGSAAAVACSMVCAALGTQTGGSVIRPAAYCGVVGFKPTRGLIPLRGVTPVSPSLDTLGWFTKSVGLSIDLARVLLRETSIPASIGPRSLRAARVDASWASPGDEVLEVLDTAGAALDQADGTVDTFDMEAEWKILTGAHRIIMLYEMSRSFEALRKRSTGLTGFSATLREVCEEGGAIPDYAYEAARRQSKACEARLRRRMEGVDFILTPSAAGPAPRGLLSTGESSFNRIWTLLGWPAIHLPVRLSREGLPLGLQLVGQPGMDGRLLRIAQWVRHLVNGGDQASITQ